MDDFKRIYIHKGLAIGVFVGVEGVAVVRTLIDDDVFSIDDSYNSENDYSYDNIAQKAVELAHDEHNERPNVRFLLNAPELVSHKLMQLTMRTRMCCTRRHTNIEQKGSPDTPVNEEEGVIHLLHLYSSNRIRFHRSQEHIQNAFAELPRYKPENQNIPRSIAEPDAYRPSLNVKALIYSVAFLEQCIAKFRPMVAPQTTGSLMSINSLKRTTDPYGRSVDILR